MMSLAGQVFRLGMVIDSLIGRLFARRHVVFILIFGVVIIHRFRRARLCQCMIEMTSNELGDMGLERVPVHFLHCPGD